MNAQKSVPAPRRSATCGRPVQVRKSNLVLPTYLPAAPDRNPMFLEKRVYQGSSGRVYPLPFTDRIAEKPVDQKWQAIWIENEFLRVLVLPELGGRIHRILDKTNNYDLVYHQPVIKPALVGLAGPWISGGIEFNWPQHHRPATFLPVDTGIERHTDGSVTIWCSDHDPLCRMKGMHGVCLHPGRAYVELKVRAYNRTPFTQTFLWWANVATRVHEGYQSFFPPDVHYVADHARRSMSAYPLAQGHYYGMNYGERGRKGVPSSEVPAQFVPPHCANKSAIHNPQSAIPDYAPNDFSFYANIPVPTSYMCMGSKEDFFGGYDHKAQAGLVHIANHHIAPGKKQWTWGNHEFGYAWDRNLTAADASGAFAPYIELMAGVFTDNQPDFSFLQPGETKSWSQYWYPIQKIGPAQHANLDAALSLRWGTQRGGAIIRLGVAVTRQFPQATILLSAEARRLCSRTRDLAPGKPFIAEVKLPKGVRETGLLLRVNDRAGRKIISYQPRPRTGGKVPPPATEPPAPADIASADELFVTGLHLEQYRHATRCPTLYWREALRRDPLDARCNNALGLWHLKRGAFKEAEAHFRQAIERLIRRNANPADGEPSYNLGLCLRYQADALPKLEVRSQESESGDPVAQQALHDSSALRSGYTQVHADLLVSAYAAFYKATWNQARAGAAFHALAELDCRRRDWATALDHLNRSLRFDADNLRARNLKVIVLRTLASVEQASRLSPSSRNSASGKTPDLRQQAAAELRATLARDPLDWWARHLNGDALACDAQTALDVAHDFARAGFYAEAVDVLGVRASARLPGTLSGAWGSATGSAGRDRRSGLKSALPTDAREPGVAPLVLYTLGCLHAQHGDAKTALVSFKQAAAAAPDYCFPARLEEIAVFEAAMHASPRDARAPYYLGNLLYDRRRHEEAIRLWEKSAKLDPSFSVVWRNLGIGYFNIRHQPAKARAAYNRAFRANPADARLLYERDQLWKRLGESPAKRLRELEKHLPLVRQRDDLSVELSALYNQVGRHADALALVSSRHFQPWEGGEGGPLGQWVRSHLALGRRMLQESRAPSPALRAPSPPMGERDRVRGMADARATSTNASPALKHFEAALTAPRNLGEAKHPLANQSDIHFWLGCAYAELGDAKQARQHWRAAATFTGDFQQMSVRAFSEMTYYSALAWRKLDHAAKAKQLFRELLAYARQLQRTEATIDYFATSLPTLLLFDDDLQFRQETTALFLQAQARLGLGQGARARRLFRTVIHRDPSHALAADFLEQLNPKQR